MSVPKVSLVITINVKSILTCYVSMVILMEDGEGLGGVRGWFESIYPVRMGLPG